MDEIMSQIDVDKLVIEVSKFIMMHKVCFISLSLFKILKFLIINLKF